MIPSSSLFNTELQHDKSQALSYLRKESLDIYNRVHSIEEDIKFVKQVHDAYPNLPLLPNLRCGAWYTDPTIVAPYPAYFKSTDGHFSNWSYNLRRPNLHLLPLISEYQGMVLVDSTRSGKRIPDALSKTVPIWCAVINRAILLRHAQESSSSARLQWDVDLHTPPGSVSSQEHSQIERLLDGWAGSLNKSSYALPHLPHPLRPIWITPASSVFPTFSDEERRFLPIICVSASAQVEEGSDRRRGGYVYVQGSGDDHELWGMGLNPGIFWNNRNQILSADRSSIDSVVSAIVSKARVEETARMPSVITKVDGRIVLCSNSDVLTTGPGTSTCFKAESGAVPYDMAFITITQQSVGGFGDEKPNLLRIQHLEGKKGQAHFLNTVLPRSVEFIQAQLSRGMRVCISCDTGKDISVGVAVVTLQKFFDEDGLFTVTGSREILDKNTIRKRLEWIIADRPEANPSRNTLKRVNEFLLTSSLFIK